MSTYQTDGFVSFRILLVIFMTLMLFLNMETNAQQQPPSPLSVVQAQLDAYNKQDVKAFAAVFALDVKIYNQVGDTIPSLTGRAAVEKRYGDLFKKYPKNYSTLAGRIVQGNYVIDHEVITGREQEARIVAIYEVKQGLIVRCWFIRE
jgi:hypothetical protein